MKTIFTYNRLLAVLTSIFILIITSCSAPIKLTSSWKNYQAKVKSSPLIMVMVIGKANSTVRQDFENSLVSRLKRDGYKAIPSSDLIRPGLTKRDSAELVSILQKNNVDMLLTNAVINITEKERFIPGSLQGTTTTVPAAINANPYSPYYNNYFGINNYYNYYNSLQTLDAPPVKGTTVTDVEVIIESNLYNVLVPELIWHAQSRSFTKEPTKKLINTFSKIVVDDIKKYDLLVK